MAPIATIGTDVALPKFLATHGLRNSEKSDFVAAAAALLLTLVLGFGLAVTFLGDALGFLLFGRAAHKEWLWVLYAMLWGSAAYALAHSYWRGCFRMAKAASLYVLCWALTPVATVVFFPNSELHGLTAFGVAITLISVAGLIRPDVWADISFSGVKVAGRLLLAHGLPRMVTALVTAFLLVAPALAATRTADIVFAGVIALGLTVIGALGSLVSPIGVVILPKIARELSEGAIGLSVVDELAGLRRLALGCAVIICAALWIMTEWTLSFFFGSDLSHHALNFQMVILGGPLYVYFAVTRYLIDATDAGLENTYTTAWATVTFFSIFLGGELVLGAEPGPLIGVSLTSAFIVLAGRGHIVSVRLLRRAVGRSA